MRVCGPWLRATLAALCLQPAMLPSQPVYRCASTYSDLPCPGGATIDVDDSRSTAQKAQTDAATVQVMRLANQMEAARLEGERANAATPTMPGRPAKSRPTRAIRTKNAKQLSSGESGILHKQGGEKKTTRTKNTATRQTSDPAYFTATARQDGNTVVAKPGD